MSPTLLRWAMAGPACAAALLAAQPHSAAAGPPPASRAVLHPGIEDAFRKLQSEFARRQPASPLAAANIAIQPDRVQFVDPATGAVLLTLVQGQAPPWFTAAEARVPETDLRLLMQLFGDPQQPSPWRPTSAAPGHAKRDDWDGQPLRKPWQLWLAAGGMGLAMLRVARTAVRRQD